MIPGHPDWCECNVCWEEEHEEELEMAMEWPPPGRSRQPELPEGTDRIAPQDQERW